MADDVISRSSKLADLATDLAVKLERACDPDKMDKELAGDLLGSLEEIDMTVELLKISKAGFAVKKCKGSKELGEGVTERAAKLLKKWKKAVAGGGASQPNNNNDDASQSQSQPPASAADAAPPALPSSEPPRPKAAGNAEGTTVEECLSEEEAGAIKDLPAPRLKIANLMLAVFLKHDVGKEDRERAARVAVGIEAAMDVAYDHKQQTKAYGDKARSLKYNLDTNEHLRFRVVVGQIDPVTLVGMKPEDMQPEEHRLAAEAAAKHAYEASQLDWHDKNFDKIRKQLGIEDVGGSFTCGRCKGNKTTYQAKQTRSSDEPMTLFICCLTCSNRWREG